MTRSRSGSDGRWRFTVHVEGAGGPVATGVADTREQAIREAWAAMDQAAMPRRLTAP